MEVEMSMIPSVFCNGCNLILSFIDLSYLSSDNKTMWCKTTWCRFFEIKFKVPTVKLKAVDG